MILDEYDAFPYRDNEVLENILMNSIKGNYVFMSATIESGDVQVLQRFHHQPLPIPTCKVMGNFMMLCHLVYQLKKYQKDKKPVFLFVPRIEMTRQVQKFLKFFSIKSHCATSKEKNIHQSLEMIKSHEIDVIVCTTVLERGMTVENVQVIILHGEHPLFDKETLIQIAGRTGRKVPYTNGDIIIYTNRQTKAIKECIKDLQQSNALSAIKS